MSDFNYVPLLREGIEVLKEIAAALLDIHHEMVTMRETAIQND